MSNTTVKLKLEGMHCASCAVDIDLTLEDIKGVVSSNTSYAASIMTLAYDSEQIQLEEIQAELEKLGYASTRLE